MSNEEWNELSEVYIVCFSNGFGDEPLGAYQTVEEAKSILEEMQEYNPDTEYWISGAHYIDLRLNKGGV